MIESEERTNEVTDESANNYLNEITTKEIPLSSTSYTINPEYKTAQINGVDTILVNLNLNITKQQLETLLAEELSNVTKNKGYVAEIAVNYKLTQYPQNYQHIYNMSFVRLLMNFFSNKTPEEEDMTKTLHQVFNAAVLTFDEETNTAKLEYENTLTEQNQIDDYVLNYLDLYENAYSVNTPASKIIMFYNIDNIDYLIENLNSVESSIEDNLEVENPKTSIPTDEVIDTPNTAESVPTYMYVISISCMVLGLLTMGYAIYREKRIG